MNEDEALQRIHVAFRKWQVQGRADEAISDLKALCSLELGSYERGQALTILGTILQQCRRWTGAREAFLDALELCFSEFSRFHLRIALAEICFSENSLDGAVHWLQQAISGAECDPSVYVGPAYRLLREHGRDEKCFADVWKLLEHALRLNWEYLTTDEPFPKDVDSCVRRLDMAEDERTMLEE